MSQYKSAKALGPCCHVQSVTVNEALMMCDSSHKTSEGHFPAQTTCFSGNCNFSLVFSSGFLVTDIGLCLCVYMFLLTGQGRNHLLFILELFLALIKPPRPVLPSPDLHYHFRTHTSREISCINEYFHFPNTVVNWYVGLQPFIMLIHFPFF